MPLAFFLPPENMRKQIKETSNQKETIGMKYVNAMINYFSFHWKECIKIPKQNTVSLDLSITPNILIYHIWMLSLLENENFAQKHFRGWKLQKRWFSPKKNKMKMKIRRWHVLKMLTSANKCRHRDQKSGDVLYILS